MYPWPLFSSPFFPPHLPLLLFPFLLLTPQSFLSFRSVPPLPFPVPVLPSPLTFSPALTTTLLPLALFFSFFFYWIPFVIFIYLFRFFFFCFIFSFIHNTCLSCYEFRRFFIPYLIVFLSSLSQCEHISYFVSLFPFLCWRYVQLLITQM